MNIKELCQNLYEHLWVFIWKAIKAWPVELWQNKKNSSGLSTMPHKDSQIQILRQERQKET